MIYAFGDYELEPQRYELRCLNVVRLLEPQVLELLSYLIRHRGRVVTKAELVKHLWPTSFVSDATLHQRLSAARKAVGDSGRDQHTIQTIRGRGYRFIASVEEHTETNTISEAMQQLFLRCAATLVVGREIELDTLHRHFAQAQGGDRQVVLISGEAGIGKTALIDAFVARISHTSALWVGHGQCIEQYGSGEPYLPLLAALGRLCRSTDGGTFIALLRQYAPSWLTQMPSLLTPSEREVARDQNITRERMLRELAEAVEMFTGERTLVLVLEDLHWSDRSTLEWLSFVARRRDPARLFVLAAYRSADVPVRGHPLRTVIAELQPHSRCQEIALHGLSEASIAAYLTQRLGPKPWPRTLPGALRERTNGNPLFLVTVVNELVAKQILQETRTGWCLPDEGAVLAGMIPNSLRRFIEQQVEQLSPEAQAILEAASVAGATFSVAAVCAGLAQTDTQVEATCTAWIRQGQFIRFDRVETWPDGTVTAVYDFIHALYYEVIYERVAAVQRSRLHRQIGARKEIGYGSRASDIAAELAVHFVSGQDPPRAIRYLRCAGDHAMQRHAYQEAMAYFEQARQALRQLPESRANREQEIDLYFDLRTALYTLSDYERVLTYLREAKSLAETLDDPYRLGWVYANLANHCGNAGEAALAVTYGQRALALATSLDDVALQVRSRLHLGQAYFYRGQFEQALATIRQNVAAIKGDRLRERFGGTGLPVILSRTWWVLCLAEMGQFTEGITRCEEMIRLAEQLNHPWSCNSAYFGASQLYLRQGSLLQAIRLLERGWELSRDLALAHWLRVLAPRLSFAYAQMGRIDEALALMAQVQAQPLTYNMMIWRSEVDLLSGHVQEANHQARHILTLAQLHQHRVLEAWALRLLGEISRHDSLEQLGMAEGYFRQALTLSDHLGMRPLQARCHHSLGTLYHQTGQTILAHAELTTAMAMSSKMEMTF